MSEELSPKGVKMAVAYVVVMDTSFVWSPIAIQKGDGSFPVVGILSAYVKFGSKVSMNGYVLRIYDKVGCPLKTAKLGNDLTKLTDLIPTGFELVWRQDLPSTVNLQDEVASRVKLLSMIPARDSKPVEVDKKSKKVKKTSKKRIAKKK
jgi:hypothetical protein